MRVEGALTVSDEIPAWGWRLAWRHMPPSRKLSHFWRERAADAQELEHPVARYLALGLVGLGTVATSPLWLAFRIGWDPYWPEVAAWLSRREYAQIERRKAARRAARQAERDRIRREQLLNDPTRPEL